MQQPDVSTPARRTAVRIEDRIRREPDEHGALIASDGRVLSERAGKPDRVPFSEAELAMAEGGTFTHNHPGGKGPSVDDVKLGCEFSMKEVRVVTATHRYGVANLRRLKVDQLQAEYALEEPKVRQAVCDDIRPGIVNRQDFGAELVHRCWERLSAHLGFVYWRQES